MNNESLLLLSNKNSSNTTIASSNSPRVKRNKSTASTAHTSTIPSETAKTTGKMTKDSFALSKLKGMKWSAFASHTRGLGLSSSSDDEDIPISELSEKVHKNSGKNSKHHKHHSKNINSSKSGNTAGVVRLDLSDMGLFGLCPETDPFYAVVCDICDAVIKPQGLKQHMMSKHSSQYHATSGSSHSASEKKTDESLHISSSKYSDDSSYYSRTSKSSSSSKSKSKNGKSLSSSTSVYTGKPSSSSSKTYSTPSLIDPSQQPNEPLIPTIVPTTTSISLDKANYNSTSSSGVSSDCPSPASSSNTSSPSAKSNSKKSKSAVSLTSSSSASSTSSNVGKSDRKVVPLKDREYDPDKHCGVYTTEKKHCMRSLTCKSHTLSLRRSVSGRSKTFDKLLSDHRLSKETGRSSSTSSVKQLDTSSNIIEVESSSNSCSSFDSRSVASAVNGDTQDPPTRPASAMAIAVVESPFKNSSNSSSPASNRSKHNKRTYKQQQQQEIVDSLDGAVTAAVSTVQDTQGIIIETELCDKSFKSNKKFKSSNNSSISSSNNISNEVLDKTLQKLVQQKVHAKYQMEQQEREIQTNRAADLFAQRFTQEIPNTILTDATVVMDPNTNILKLSVSGTLKPTNEAEAPEEQIQQFATTLMQEPLTVTVPLSVISTMNLNDPSASVAGNPEMMMIEQITAGQTQELQIPTYEEYVSLTQNLPADQTMQAELSENIDDIVPTINLLPVTGEFSESIILANNQFIEDDSLNKGMDVLSVNMNSTDFSKLLILKNIDDEFVKQSQEQKMMYSSQIDELRGVKVWYNTLPKPLHINNFQMRQVGGSLVLRKKLIAIRKAMVGESQNMNSKTLSAQISPLPRSNINFNSGNQPSTVSAMNKSKDINGGIILHNNVQNNVNSTSNTNNNNRFNNNNRGQRRLIVPVTRKTGLGNVLSNPYFKNLLSSQSPFNAQQQQQQQQTSSISTTPTLTLAGGTSALTALSNKRLKIINNLQNSPMPPQLLLQSPKTKPKVL